jgi:hypothetical protein
VSQATVGYYAWVKRLWQVILLGNIRFILKTTCEQKGTKKTKIKRNLKQQLTAAKNAKGAKGAKRMIYAEFRFHPEGESKKMTEVGATYLFCAFCAFLRLFQLQNSG